MSSSSWVDPRISRVRVEDVRSYLLEHGWQLRTYPRPELLVFEGPRDNDGQPITLVLPSSEQYRDYRMRVEDLIGALGVLENRWAVDVLNDILASTSTNGAAEPPAGDDVAAPAHPV